VLVGHDRDAAECIHVAGFSGAKGHGSKG
jgi:hypothetical protein